jgi:hypothetical protein
MVLGSFLDLLVVVDFDYSAKRACLYFVFTLHDLRYLFLSENIAMHTLSIIITETREIKYT